jgi:holin-like protein
LLRHLRRIHWLQVGGLIAIWAVAQAAARAWHWPLPGSVVALLVVWLLLERRWLPARWIETGADNLLDHLMLFFVPAMLGLVDHPELLSGLGAKLLAAVLIGTVTVMGGTALIVETGFRLSAARHARVR